MDEEVRLMDPDYAKEKAAEAYAKKWEHITSQHDTSKQSETKSEFWAFTKDGQKTARERFLEQGEKLQRPQGGADWRDHYM